MKTISIIFNHKSTIQFLLDEFRLHGSSVRSNILTRFTNAHYCVHIGSVVISVGTRLLALEVGPRFLGKYNLRKRASCVGLINCIKILGGITRYYTEMPKETRHRGKANFIDAPVF